VNSNALDRRQSVDLALDIEVAAFPFRAQEPMQILAFAD
jgi:hypothetical protein